jgi:glycosyltransferase involved in cell wall biosynthesis
VFQEALLEAERDRLGERGNLQKTDYFPGKERMIAEYAAADHIVTCSSYSRSSFLAQGIAPEKVTAIPLGANFPPQDVDRAGRSRFVVLCVGTHPYRKGVWYLLEAWKTLHLPSAELWLRTPIPKVLNGAVAADATIKVIPPQSRASLQDLYRQADVFCLPSIDDGFGMVVLEAMAFGLPVVISTHVGAADVIADGKEGLIVPVRDSGCLAGAIERLYKSSRLRDELGTNGRLAAARLTWQKYCEQLRGLYSRLTGPPAKVSNAAR